MAKWEYLTQIVNVSKTGPQIDLAAAGANGWELVSVVPKTTISNMPEWVVKPSIGSQKVSPQQAATLTTVELIYLFKRVCG